MAQVRAGIAYVDVKLGNVENFMTDLKKKVESAGREMGQKVGDAITKNVPKNIGADIGKTTSANMSRAFFQDAKTSFGGGLRALATGQFRTFATMMRQAGAAGSAGLRAGFFAGFEEFRRLPKFLGSVVSTAMDGVRVVGNKVGSVFKPIPEAIGRAGQAIDGFSKRLGFLSFQLTNFGFIVSSAFTAPVAAILGFGAVIGIKTAASIEQATASLKALTPAGTDVEAVIKRLQALAQASPIFNTSDVVTFTQKMVASGLSVKQTEAFLKSFGNIALSVGADIQKIPFALEAIVQMVGKGKVSMEELRLQLGDALPGAMTIVSKALNITTKELYDMVEAGKITGTQLVKALTKLGQTEPYLSGASKGAETLGAKWQALKESVQANLGNVFLENSDKIKKGLEDLGPALSDLIKLSGPAFGELTKGFTKVVEKISDLVNWYKELDPGTKDLVNTLMLIAIVLGPLVLIAGAFGAALAGITALIAAIATPVGAIVIGLIAFAIEGFAIIKMIKNLYKEGGKFKEVWDSVWKAVVDLMKPVGEEFKKIWVDIKAAFDQIKNAFTENQDVVNMFVGILKAAGITIGIIVAVIAGVIYAAFRGIVGAIGPIIRMIGSILSGLVKIFLGVIAVIKGIITGDFEAIKNGLLSIWNGLWDLIVGTIVNAVKAIVGFVSGFVSGIVGFFKWLYDILVGHSIIPDMVNAILDWFKKLVNAGKNIISNLGSFFSAFYSNYVAPFINSIKSGIERAVTFFTSLPGKIKNAFSSAASWLVNAGKNIVNGLVNGVRSMAGVLRNAIVNLIPAPVRGIVEEALGIHSPSRVFMDIGKNIVLGLIAGVKDTTPKMITEMNSLANSIPDLASPAYSDRSNPILSRSSPDAALKIENYYANNDDDPRRQAEDWYFVISSRGGVA